jgi:DNA-binding MarR family transcriptional regulator
MLRWINHLAEMHLISRESHPTDMRKVVIELTHNAQHSLDLHFSETLTPKR